MPSFQSTKAASLAADYSTVPRSLSVAVDLASMRSPEVECVRAAGSPKATVEPVVGQRSKVKTLE